MEDEYVQGATNESEQRFSKLEIQVTDISHNMSILMAARESKFKPFGDFGVSNSNFGFEGKSKDKNDP